MKGIITYIMSVGGSDMLIPNFFLTKKEQRWLLKIIIRVVKKFPDYKLIIKGRGDDKTNDMNLLAEDIAKEEGLKDCEVIRTTDNFKLLQKSDIIIIQNTDMGHQALLLNKPVISLELKHMKKYSSFNNIPAVKQVFTEIELEKELRRLIEPKMFVIGRK